MTNDNHSARAGGVRPRTAGAKAAGKASRIQTLTPSPLALEYARDVSARVRDSAAPVRNGFIERLSPSDADPPLARMLRGGQGGEVRLKLLLSLLWFSRKPPHDTEYPARGWAGLLDLPQPDTNGARRINAAVTWLAERGFVRAVSHRGRPTTVYLNDERGDGKEYTPPFKVIKALKEAGTTISRDNYYIGLPHGFWTKGWISVLRAPAVAMLLVMIDESMYKRSPKKLWHSPRQAWERFALSQDTRSNGLIELEHYGIVSSRRTPIAPGVFDFKRMRNVYDLHMETLTVDPGSERPERPLNPEQVAEDIAESDEPDAEKE